MQFSLFVFPWKKALFSGMCVRSKTFEINKFKKYGFVKFWTLYSVHLQHHKTLNRKRGHLACFGAICYSKFM